MDEFWIDLGLSIGFFLLFGFALEMCEVIYQVLVKIRRRRLPCWNKTMSRALIRELKTQQD